MMRKMLILIGSVVFVYALLVGIVFVMQRTMMYIPSPEKPSLERAGIGGLQEINVRTEDGLNLFGWYKAPAAPDKPVIVWFHGNASNAYITAMRARPYVDNGYGLLAAEYRGYAGNPGAPTEQGLYKDARAFIEWLKQNGAAENNIVVYGESIGTGPAVQMATDYAALRALVLESPFTSAVDAGAFHYPFLPVKWLMKDRYNNIAKIRTINTPLIVAYGDADEIIPHRFGEKLYNEAPEPKSLIVIPGGGHNNLDQFYLSEKVMGLLSE